MTLPKGMTRTVRAAWTRIDKVVTEALEPYEDIYDSALATVDPDHDMLGCGYWGCAYPTEYSRWVVKISADPLEGPIIKAVMEHPELREHPGIAYIIDIWRLAEKVRWGRSAWRDVWVILRENIEPTDYVWGSPGVCEAADLLWNLKLVGERFNNAADALDEKGPGYGRRARLNEYNRKWQDYVIQAQKVYLTHQIGSFMEEFYHEFDAVLADVHRNNVGLRGHSLADLGLKDHEPAEYWVAFDLGHSSVDVDVEVPLVPNPGIRRI